MQNERFCLSRSPEALGVYGIELGKQKIVGHLVLEDMTLKPFKTEHCRKTVGTTFSKLPNWVLFYHDLRVSWKYQKYFIISVLHEV